MISPAVSTARSLGDNIIDEVRLLKARVHPQCLVVGRKAYYSISDDKVMCGHVLSSIKPLLL